MVTFEELQNFYCGKKVFVTGHTGFKGSWLVLLLLQLGAEVTGYAFPAKQGELFDLLQLEDKMHSIVGDVRDKVKLKQAVRESEALVVVHLAAQPLVRASYQEPAYTYETNLMGTVNILEAVRLAETVKSFINVTTDKVYLNHENNKPFIEEERLDGYDPYSNSKSCSELITACYKRSFFTKRDISISTVRAGNVIGGGDFAEDRIIPDCARASMAHETIIIRNPMAVRPFQHVIEPIVSYLVLAMKQYENQTLADCYNIGPEESDCVTAGELASLFCASWGQGQTWVVQGDQGAQEAHEAGVLRLDSSKIKNRVDITPRWGIAQSIEETVKWYKEFEKSGDIYKCMIKQIERYMNLC